MGSIATVHFYRGSYNEISVDTTDGKNLKKVEKPIPFAESEAKLKNIINENINKEKCILLEDDPKILMEVIGVGKFEKKLQKHTNKRLMSCDYIFGRLGKKKDINNIHKRNEKNYSSKSIETEEDEYLEVFTYFYLYFEKNRKDKEVITIAYLAAQSAPNIRILGNLISRYANSEKRELQIVPIISSDMIELIKKKDIINAFTFSVAVPSDEIMSKVLKLDMNEFDSFRNIKETELVISIKGAVNKDILEKRDSMDKIRDFGKENKEIKKMSVRAKNKDEKMLAYDFFDNQLVAKTDIEYSSNDGNKRLEEIEEKLYKKYMDNRNDILNAIN